MIQEGINRDSHKRQKDKPTTYGKKCRNTRKTGQHRHVKRQENHTIKDMSIKQESKDDRKNEGQKYIDNVGRLQNLGSFLNFQDSGA